ncbi:helix-turn-helix domain-containing protein [Salegentibacter mishustinae]|uniref:helix-turn-helix domain-containing protein n=1 Tax=Salegentibacter mishustinae TaxID=270918 RepID=UPI001CE1443E|nr:helix-turn-helix transcriptional regulator [Salegentibacter mishustinae]UBZ08105.1 helix-turn-helix domain-containing protein [Salegentibacter mishustinae]
MDRLQINRKSEIFETLRARMRELKITNYRLHKLSGVSESSISRYFSNESDMSLQNFLKIIEALDLNLYLVPNENITNEIESKLNRY